MASYVPQPIDTSKVVIPGEIKELQEILAKNTHEVWSQGRIAEGWSYGTGLNHEKKTHPGLIPYEELSESEKDYDRRTSQETLKVILSLGYKIVKE